MVARSALIATSRVMISMTIHASTRPSAISMMSEAVTSTLSAMGSRKRPNDDSTLKRLAMNPSKKSVSDAIKKMKAASADQNFPGKNKRTTMGGTRTNRPNVRKLGTYFVICSRSCDSAPGNPQTRVVLEALVVTDDLSYIVDSFAVRRDPCIFPDVSRTRVIRGQCQAEVTIRSQ